MRIALVHLRHAATGGTERFLNALAPFLCEAGHEVTVVCRRHEDPPHPAVRFEVLHGLALGAAWRQWSFARSVEKHVRAADYDLVFALGKTWTHDVIRAGGGCHATYLEEAGRHTGSALERALHTRWLKDRAALEIERRAYAPGSFTRAIVNSHMVERDLVARYGVDPADVEVIYNGVDLERFHPRRRAEGGRRVRAEAGLDPDHRVVLFMGRGFGRKGLERVLCGFPAVARERPEARLLVAGGDRAEASYRALAEELGLSEVTHFLGERRDPEDVYAAADLFVLPTRYDPFPFSVLEALASGVPTITSTHAGAAEILEGTPAGAVVGGRGSVEELAEAMLSWTEPGRAREGRAEARALAENFPFARTLEATAGVLHEAARRRGR